MKVVHAGFENVLRGRPRSLSRSRWRVRTSFFVWSSKFRLFFSVICRKLSSSPFLFTARRSDLIWWWLERWLSISCFRTFTSPLSDIRNHGWPIVFFFWVNFYSSMSPILILSRQWEQKKLSKFDLILKFRCATGAFTDATCQTFLIQERKKFEVGFHIIFDQKIVHIVEFQLFVLFLDFFAQNSFAKFSFFSLKPAQVHFSSKKSSAWSAD